nr:MAG TPA: hypothetical protein [Caudoviricetes sp.]DAY82220.1 MAG TPA: hypothetical protein [Caudoviricetes sp.]
MISVCKRNVYRLISFCIHNKTNTIKRRCDKCELYKFL